MSKIVQNDDTIAAVATASGYGGIGIVRMSGPESIQVSSKLFSGAKSPADLSSSGFIHGWVKENNETLDEVICLVMKAPNSYTGQDVVEFHCHGGPTPIGRVLNAIIDQGVRPAGPGEFTRRAFLAGKIDLSQAEAVQDLITSKTDQAGRAAISQLDGGLSERISEMRRELAELLARLEAGIDFSDEEDVVAVPPQEMSRKLELAWQKITTLLNEAKAGRRYREGARVVITGKPNVGKSTLMNALLKSERVIVDPTPGTTRDVVEDTIELAGMPLRLFDTAGIRENAGDVEKIGIDRAKDTLSSADLALLLLDGSKLIDENDKKWAAQMECPSIIVINKNDLPQKINIDEIKKIAKGAKVISISALSKEGIDTLEDSIKQELLGDYSTSETPVLTNIRHIKVLYGARDAILRAAQASSQEMSEEFTASDLRLALDSLSEITGETATDEILDMIFAKFCIGK